MAVLAVIVVVVDSLRLFLSALYTHWSPRCPGGLPEPEQRLREGARQGRHRDRQVHRHVRHGRRVRERAEDFNEGAVRVLDLARAQQPDGRLQGTYERMRARARAKASGKPAESQRKASGKPMNTNANANANGSGGEEAVYVCEGW